MRLTGLWQVTVHASVNEALDDESVIRQQAHEIARLKKMLQAAARTGGPAAGADDGTPTRGRGDVDGGDEAGPGVSDREDVRRLREDNVALAARLKRAQQVCGWHRGSAWLPMDRCVAYAPVATPCRTCWLPKKTGIASSVPLLAVE